MGSREAQESEGTRAPQVHLGVQGPMGTQGSPDHQDRKVSWGSTGSEVLRGRLACRGTEDHLDRKEPRRMS